MTITLQPQDFWGGGDKRENIILHTQNDLLHKMEKKKTPNLFRLLKLYGVFEAEVCVETRMETCLRNLGCNQAWPTRGCACNREAGTGSAWRLALPLSHQIASWENSWTCGSNTEAPTGNESHAMTPTKEPQPAQICWEQGSFRRGPSAESGLGSLPRTGQEAGADVDLWQRDDTCDSEDGQSPPNPDKSVRGGGQHKATPLGAGV